VPSNSLCSTGSGADDGGYTVVVTSSGTTPNKVFGNYTPGTVLRAKFESATSSGNLGDGVVPSALTGWTITAYASGDTTHTPVSRSEERRVEKECRFLQSPST